MLRSWTGRNLRTYISALQLDGATAVTLWDRWYYAQRLEREAEIARREAQERSDDDEEEEEEEEVNRKMQ